MTRFVEYWTNLKRYMPEEYERQLKANRERVKKSRRAIYQDPVKHEIYKKKQRDVYRKRTAIKSKLDS